MVPIIINKDVFEPSHYDLKFTIQNHNYICTNILQSKEDGWTFVTHETSMNLISKMMSEGSQAWKTTYPMVPFI